VKDGSHDPIRLGIEHYHSEVDGPVVESHPDFGSFCGRRAVGWPALSKPGRGIGGLPNGLVQDSVDPDRVGGPNSPNGGAGFRSRRRLLTLANLSSEVLGGNGPEESQECEGERNPQSTDRNGGVFSHDLYELLRPGSESG
jgi:hypothetical protein